MNPSQNKDVRSRAASPDSAEDTLRIVATLPPPEGLVDRVQTRLRTAPRSSRILSWPLALAPGHWAYAGAIRGAAAAAIVCVVAGGGWRIYSRVQTGPSARILVMPAPSGPARGFSIGGSVHAPDPGRGHLEYSPNEHGSVPARRIPARPVFSRPAQAPQPIQPRQKLADPAGKQGNAAKSSGKAAPSSPARPQQP